MTHASLTPALYTALSAVDAATKLWQKLEALETALLRDRLPPLHHPLYVSGLPRGGSTVLFEMLAAHPDVAAHRNEDFPFIHTPYLWGKALQSLPRAKHMPAERFHGDGLLSSPATPAALDAMAWRLSANYPNHVRKLLLARGKPHYAAKNNSLWQHLNAFTALMPEARVVVPVREPLAHVASLMRQHARFSEACNKDARLIRYLKLAGHFEFGPHRTPQAVTQEDLHAIRDAWAKGEEARGWAIAWRAAYTALANSSLQKHTVRFETLHGKPEETIRALLDFCGLSPHQPLIEAWSARISPHHPQAPQLTSREIDAVLEETSTTRHAMDYA